MAKVYCATKGLILKNGKFLVIKQVNNGKEFVDIPGGRMEHGLSPEENLIREIKEEVNLDIKVGKLAGVWYFFRQDGDQVVCITYSCTPMNQKIKLDGNPDKDEYIVEYKWMTPEEFLRLENEDFKSLENMKTLVKEHFKVV